MNSTWEGKTSLAPSCRAPFTPTIWPWQVSYMKTEVGLVDGVVDAHDVGGLVEGEAGLELPRDVLASVGGDIAAGLPGGDDAIQRGAVVDLAMDGRRLDAIDADALDAEVAANSEFLRNSAMYLVWSSVLIEFLAPQVGGDAAEGRGPWLHLGLEFRALRLLGHGAGPFVIRTVGVAGIGWGGNAPSSTPSKPSSFSWSQTVSKAMGWLA